MNKTDRTLNRGVMLVCATEEHAPDLLAWAEAHTEDLEYADATVAWLKKVYEIAGSLPSYTPVPPIIVEDIEYIVDDWTEVLGSQDEDSIPMLAWGPTAF